MFSRSRTNIHTATLSSSRQTWQPISLHVLIQWENRSIVCFGTSIVGWMPIQNLKLLRIASFRWCWFFFCLPHFSLCEYCRSIPSVLWVCRNICFEKCWIDSKNFSIVCSHLELGCKRSDQGRSAFLLTTSQSPPGRASSVLSSLLHAIALNLQLSASPFSAKPVRPWNFCVCSRKCLCLN